MSEVMVLENTLDAGWQRKVRLMAGKAEALDDYQVPAHATVKRFEDDIHLHHLEASWSARELIRVPMGAATWQVVAWWIGTDKVSASMLEAGLVFALAFGVDPACAMIRSLPKGVEEFVEVKGIALVQAGWVPQGFLAVTSGGMWRGLAPYHLKEESVSV
jgi:hypothetical protein